MGLQLVSRASDSVWISSVWTSRSTGVEEMTAIASESWGLVFWVQEGAHFAGIVGPETRSSSAPVPREACFTGIQFAVGTTLRGVPAGSLVDRGLPLTASGSRTFRLDGEDWEAPSADDAEALVRRLMRRGILVRDPLVAEAFDDQGLPSTRALQRRFRAVTGLSRGALQQIRRARAAATMLSTGQDVAGVVTTLGYYDEPHLARALRRFVGRTAGDLRAGRRGVLALPDLAHDLVHDFDHPVGIGG